MGARMFDDVMHRRLGDAVQHRRRCGGDIAVDDRGDLDVDATGVVHLTAELLERGSQAQIVEDPRMHRMREEPDLFERFLCLISYRAQPRGEIRLLAITRCRTELENEGRELLRCRIMKL